MLITNLPVEIQTRIFAEVYWEERELNIAGKISSFLAYLDADDSPSQPPIFPEHETQWIGPWYGDLLAVRNPFPNNAASVCRLWRSIMSNTSRFWSRFILDFDDPACLPLDVFSWSGSRVLDVVIKSRPQETSEDAKIREKSRVLAAFKALTPYISSCKSIIFDVKYASSLPSPSPFFTSEHRHLKTLKMDSQIYDVVLPIFDITPAVSFAEKFSNFRNLSLHGAIFMELSRADPTWLEQRSRYNERTTLTLSNLEYSPQDESSYTVAELTEYLSLPPTLSELVFKHIRFVGQHGPQDIPDDQVSQDVGALTFEDVDPGFIYAFLPFLSSRCIIFKNCRIPRILETRTMQLSLTDIPDRRSLKNMLRHHNGSTITFTSCPGFDDNFLNYLATNLSVPELRTLRIHECDRFTVAGLRTFLKARKDATPDISDLSAEQIDPDEAVGAITHLSVRWTGLRLTDEDKAWFQGYFGERDYISWKERGHYFVHPPSQSVAT